MSDPVSVKSSIELIDGQLTLRIPLDEGGEELISCTSRFASVESDYLYITLPDWMTERLGVSEGSVVVVDNRDGKFNVRLDVATIH
jgi:hypothetical protein